MFYSIKAHLLGTTTEVYYVKQILASNPLALSVYLLTTEIYLGILNHKWPIAGHILCLITALSYNSKSFPECLWVPHQIYLNSTFQEHTAGPCQTNKE